MPGNLNKVEDPCQACRERHLKCDDGRPKCRQCERLGHECNRENAKHKFRWGSSARYDQTFPDGQVWLVQSKNAKLQFVDQGPELENFYSSEDYDNLTMRIPSTTRTRSGTNTPDPRPFSSDVGTRSPHTFSAAASDTAVFSPALISTEFAHGVMHHKRQRTEETPVSLINTNIHRPRSADQDPRRLYVLRESSRQSEPFGPHIFNPQEDSQLELNKVYAEYERLEDTLAAEIPSQELLSPAVWKRHFVWPNNKTTTQCACLMRYYTEYLGPWLDIGDPLRHFTLIVPQRARRCPPLLNAIFTIAARHLARLPQFKTSEGVVRYQNNLLPRLDDRQAIKYQNATIAYLRALLDSQDQPQDDDLLAATIVLRYYDELDSSLGADRDETVMRTIQLHFARQVKPPFDSSDFAVDFQLPGAFSVVRLEAEAYLKGFQHASFRIALRQECARAFMKQSAIGLPLHRWSILQGFDEAEDIVWADRHLYHLANVLQFCFDEDKRGQWSSGRWQELKGFEKQWDENKPLSFAAIHYKERDLAAGDPLPEIWYLAEIHAAAMQYFNLARILLMVYNPATPRLGPGASLAAKRMSRDVRRLVTELCGIARSMPESEPALIQAYMAIALCGEHFTNRLEQEALMHILSDLETRHGFPTFSTVASLQQAWSW